MIILNIVIFMLLPYFAIFLYREHKEMSAQTDEMIKLCDEMLENVNKPLKHINNLMGKTMKQYAIYARMGVGYEWMRLITTNDLKIAQERKEHYQKTWRVVEIREESSLTK